MSLFSTGQTNQHYRQNTMIKPFDQAIIQCSTFQDNMEAGGAEQDENKNFIYVVGGIHAYFPNLGVAKEFYQACLLSGVDVSLLDGVNDEVALARVNSNVALSALLYQGLGKSQSSYLMREMQWTFNNTDSNEIYSLLPLSDENLKQFVAALESEKQQVILVGQLVNNESILVSNMVSTKSSAVMKIPASEKQNVQEFSELMDEMLSLNANDGFQPFERGLNYLIYNNTKIYLESYALCYKANPNGPNPSGYQLVNVEPITYWSGHRLIAKIIFHYQGINTGAMQSWYSAADVTGEYPFMLTEWKRFLPQR